MKNHNLLVVIHSDSLKRANDEDKEIIDTFLKCSELDEILMLAAPTTDLNWSTPYKRIFHVGYKNLDNKSYGADYKTQNHETSALFHDSIPQEIFISLYGFQKDSPELKEIENAFHDLLAFEAISKNSIDSIFVSQSPYLLQKSVWIQKRFEVKILSFLQALEYIDLYLRRLNSSFYYSAPHYRIIGGNAFFYWFLLKELVPKFAEAWAVAVFGADHIQNGKELMNKLGGLAAKFENALCSSDHIAMEYMKPPNNSTQWEMLYNLNYFCMLVTGIFDLLAWLTASYYSIPIKNPRQVTIRMTGHKSEGTKFVSAIARFNPSLASFIVTKQDFIHMFYPMRDAVQHREPVVGAQFAQANEGWTLSVATLKQDAPSAIKMVDQTGYPFTRFGLLNTGTPNLLEPSRFTRKALRELIYFTNAYIELLDFPLLVAKRQDLVDKITSATTNKTNTPFIAKVYWKRDCHLPILFRNK